MCISSNPAASLRGSTNFLIVLALAGVMALVISDDALAQPLTPVNLGAAAPFRVLGASTVTNTVTATVINGDLGLSPGTSVTNFPPGVVTGTIYINTQEANDGQAALTTAYNDAAGRTPPDEVVTADLGGRILAPGLYQSATSILISSDNVTLDAGGDADAVWIFQMVSELSVSAGRQVFLSGGAQATNVFWQVGSSATIGVGAAFIGTIMADQSVALQTDATLCGRALARVAAVTLDNNTVTLDCSTLPIEMSSFSATADEFDVILSWETMSESNNSGFEVQYQSDTAWEALAFVEGAGNSMTRRNYEYRVKELASGTHRFRLKQIDFDGSASYSSVIEVDVSVPDRYELGQAYPNPFNPMTVISLAVAEKQTVRAVVYDALGHEVQTVLNGLVEANQPVQVRIDAGNLPSGAYIVRFQGEQFVANRQIVLAK